MNKGGSFRIHQYAIHKNKAENHKELIFPSEKSNGIERKIPGDKLETEQFKFQCDHYAHHQQRKETDHIFYLDLQARDDPIAQPHQQHDKE